jgi:hypothetical protein
VTLVGAALELLELAAEAELEPHTAAAHPPRRTATPTPTSL